MLHTTSPLVKKIGTTDSYRSVVHTQDFLEIPNLWKAALETEQRCFSIFRRIKMLLSMHLGNQTSQHSPPRVNRGDWGCSALGLKTIIVFILFTFTFISKKVAPLTFHCSGKSLGPSFEDNAIATLTPGDGTTAFKPESSEQPTRSFFSRKWTGVTITVPKTLPPIIHDTTLTSLLREPCTILCDRLMETVTVGTAQNLQYLQCSASKIPL